MNKHIFYDNLTAGIGALVTGKKKFFANSFQSSGFGENIQNTKISIPEITQQGTFEITAKTAAGNLDPAFQVVQWSGNNFPTIIYHHGNNERPFDFRKTAKNTFYQIFINTKEEIQANLIVVRAPFHNYSLKVYQNKMTDLENFVAMIATSVKLNDVTGALNTKALRGHILEVLQKI